MELPAGYTTTDYYFTDGLRTENGANNYYGAIARKAADATTAILFYIENNGSSKTFSDQRSKEVTFTSSVVHTKVQVDDSGGGLSPHFMFLLSSGEVVIFEMRNDGSTQTFHTYDFPLPKSPTGFA